MPITWKSKFNPEPIFKKIAGQISRSQDGYISFSGFEVHSHTPIIISMLDFPASARRINHVSLVWSALANVGENLNKKTFENAINEALKKNLATKIMPYHLIASISLSSKGMPKSIKIENTAIEFLTNNQKKKYVTHYELIKSNAREIVSTPENYSAIRIRASGKSAEIAAQEAIDTVDLFRGIACLYLNITMQWQIFSNGTTKPINKIRCGGTHTIHDTNGKPASEGVWVEMNFKPGELYEPENPESLLKAITRDIRWIHKSHYKDELKNSLIRYARAFDEPDPNTAFLKLWSSLENLVNSDSSNYDSMIKRCSFLYAERDYHKQVLEHLREYRNRSIHSGIETNDALTNCFLLQGYFRRAIHFYKHHYKIFSSLKEANEFLDLPHEQVDLQNRLKLIKRAIRYVSPKNKKS